MKKDEFDNIYGELHLLAPRDHINIDRIGNELYEMFKNWLAQNNQAIDEDHTSKVKELVNKLEQNHLYAMKVRDNETEDAINRLEEKYESDLCDIRIELMKKYEGVKYQKLALDIDSSLNMCDIAAIKFN